MQGCKHWMCSKTIRFLVVALVALVITIVCIAKGWNTGQIIALVTAIAGVIGGMWGRAVATEKITG